MKNIFLVALLVTFFGCAKDNVVNPSIYNCNLSYVDDSESHPKKDRFESAMRKVISEVPGTQVAVRSKDGNIWLGAQGYADVTSAAPFENCTRTLVGSVTKLFTAVTVMQLVDENILSIDDLASNWLDTELVNEIANLKDVTIKHLLNHTSGIPDYLEHEHLANSINIPYHQLTVREKLELIYGKSAIHAINEKHNYSNSNYVLLGLIIEKARNMPLETAITDFIANPIGANNTTMGTSDNPVPDNAARSYLSLHKNKYINVDQFAVSDAATADGGIITNMQESLSFIESIFDHTLISEEALANMLSKRVSSGFEDAFGEDNYYGLGFEINLDGKNGPAYGHTGSTAGYWSFLHYYPDSDVYVAVAYNGDTEDDTAYGKLIDMIFEITDIAIE